MTASHFEELTDEQRARLNRFGEPKVVSINGVPYEPPKLECIPCDGTDGPIGAKRWIRTLPGGYKKEWIDLSGVSFPKEDPTYRKTGEFAIVRGYRLSGMPGEPDPTWPAPGTVGQVEVATDPRTDPEWQRMLHFVPPYLRADGKLEDGRIGVLVCEDVFDFEAVPAANLMSTIYTNRSKDA